MLNERSILVRTGIVTICVLMYVLILISNSVAQEAVGTLILALPSDLMPAYVTQNQTNISKFVPIHIRITKISDDNKEERYWESNITEPGTTSVSAPIGKYKIYVREIGSNTVREYNNDGNFYSIGSQNETVVIPLYPNTFQKDILADAPWRVEPNITIPIYCMVKDADQNDYPLKYIKIYDDMPPYGTNDSNEDVLVYSCYINQNIVSDLWYRIYDVNPADFTKPDEEVHIHVMFDASGDPFDEDVHTYLKVKIANEAIPVLPNWYAGDTHYHSFYTDNIWEFGAPIYPTTLAGKALGLDWITITDHSFDLNPQRWNNFLNDCHDYSSPSFLVIAGEEVSCYLPGTTQYNHYLAYNITDFIPGGEWEAIGSDTSSDYTPAEVVSKVNEQGGIGYVAHPLYDDEFRDPWQDYSLNFTGLQIWNGKGGNWESKLNGGLTIWKELLLDGRKVYIEGGSDAHGDLNGAFATVRTYGYTTNLTKHGILRALRNGNSIMTDGPLVIFDINGEMIGNSLSLNNGTNATLHILWNSTAEFGIINSISVKKGVINETEEINFTTIQPSSIEKNTLRDERELIISPNESCYYRVEVFSTTTNGEQYRCYTNPIWVDVVSERFSFDTGEGTYPGISGTHNGTIKPNQTVTVSRLYTYPCVGTGGHTEYAKIWNSTLDVIAIWDGYKGDWHNISFNDTFTLFANETYNYTIITGSYPQIHHTDALPTSNGWINCTEFVDANGKKYNDGIPAIKLFKYKFI